VHPYVDRPLSLENIARASLSIDPVFLDTPQFRVDSMEVRLGCRVVVKVETLNPIRSFKARGTEYFMASLEDRPRLVCTTAGNFGQGIAYSARRRGLEAVVFCGGGTSPLKVERMRTLGADVRLVGRNFDDAKVAAEAFAVETGARTVEDGREPAITEGAGTIGRELLRWPDPFDAILVPLGDGALLGGVAMWVKAHHPETRMIGVCASGTPAMERSWRAGKAEKLEGGDTIADGIAVRNPYPEAVARLTGLVDDIVLVDDDRIIESMRHAHREIGVVLEPSGAAALAALNTHRERFQGQTVGVILTGGNLTPEQMRQWLSS
jgi:threonine dehydratase